MTSSKHQCLARLDEVELDKLDVIRSASGLSRSAAIRRLIRDFNLESDSTEPTNKFIVNGQISKNIFMQLTEKNWNIEIDYLPDCDSRIKSVETYVDGTIDDGIKIEGFVKYPLALKSSMREFYQHDILYWFESRLYKTTVFSWDIGESLPVNREYYNETIAQFREIENQLQQIFVV